MPVQTHPVRTVGDLRALLADLPAHLTVALRVEGITGPGTNSDLFTGKLAQARVIVDGDGAPVDNRILLTDGS